MSNEDRSAGRRTASLHCRPHRPRVIYLASGGGGDGDMSRWSEYPATQPVSVGCDNQIVDVSGIQFCDGSYLGYGASLDITSTDHIVMTARGISNPNTSNSAPKIEILTAPAGSSTAYANMRVAAGSGEVFALRAAPDASTPPFSIVANSASKTLKLSADTTTFVELDSSANIVVVEPRIELPLTMILRYVANIAYRGDYFIELTASTPSYDTSTLPILQDGQIMTIINAESSGTRFAAGNFYEVTSPAPSPTPTPYTQVELQPLGIASFRGSLSKQIWVAMNLRGASFL